MPVSTVVVTSSTTGCLPCCGGCSGACVLCAGVGPQSIQVVPDPDPAANYPLSPVVTYGGTGCMAYYLGAGRRAFYSPPAPPTPGYWFYDQTQRGGAGPQSTNWIIQGFPCDSCGPRPAPADVTFVCVDGGADIVVTTAEMTVTTSGPVCDGAGFVSQTWTVTMATYGTWTVTLTVP